MAPVMQELPLMCLMLLLLCRDPGKWGLHSPITQPYAHFPMLLAWQSFPVPVGIQGSPLAASLPACFYLQMKSSVYSSKSLGPPHPAVPSSLGTRDRNISLSPAPGSGPRSNDALCCVPALGPLVNSKPSCRCA